MILAAQEKGRARGAERGAAGVSRSKHSFGLPCQHHREVFLDTPNHVTAREQAEKPRLGGRGRKWVLSEFRLHGREL
jgi:hypothetical protein